MSLARKSLGPVQWPAGFTFQRASMPPAGNPRTTGKQREPVTAPTSVVTCFRCKQSNGTLVKVAPGRYAHKHHMAREATS